MRSHLLDHGLALHDVLEEAVPEPMLESASHKGVAAVNKEVPGDPGPDHVAAKCVRSSYYIHLLSSSHRSSCSPLILVLD